MSLKNIAVKDFQYNINVGGAVIGSGNLSVNTPVSTNAKVIVGVDKKGIYAGSLNITVSNYADINISQGTGVGVINPSATKTKVDNQFVVLEGDSGDVVLSGVHPQSGSPVSGYTVNVKIISAGQTVVKAE
jgi:hypothetical protein